MILKVWNENTQRWCLIDNIKSVEKGFAFMVKQGLKGKVSTVACRWEKEPKKPKKGEGQGTNFYPDYDFVPTKVVMEIADGKKAVVRVGALVMEMRHSDSKIAVFCNMAYLLNDDGKTIEKL